MKKFLASAVAMLVMAMSGDLLAQDSQTRKRVEEERRQAFESIQKKEDALDKGWWYDYGGWLRTSLYLYDDALDNSTTLLDADLRGYFDLQYSKIHQMYMRFRLSGNRYSDQDGPFDDSDIEGPVLDQGYYRLDLDRLFAAGGNDIPVDAYIKAGRQFLILGDGIAFNQTADAVSAQVRHHWFTLYGFAAKSIRSNSDFDSTRPKAEDSKRDFIGGQLSLTFLDKHSIFVYAFAQNDNNNNGSNPVPGQGYEYDSDYWAVGMDGELPIRNLHYHWEYVDQGGRSTAAGTILRESINAWAFEFKLDYLWDKVYSKPRFNFAFLTGSGDRDRRNLTGSVNGNVLGTSDKGFIDFGFVETGYSLAPRVANLKIWNIGASAQLLEKWSWGKDMQFGANVYWYNKKIGDTVISDGTAINRSKRVGWEFDIYMNWRIVSDLTFTMQYGHFSPGRAFPDRSNRDFFSMSLTYSF